MRKGDRAAQVMLTVTFEVWGVLANMICLLDKQKYDHKPLAFPTAALVKL